MQSGEEMAKCVTLNEMQSYRKVQLYASCVVVATEMRPINRQSARARHQNAIYVLTETFDWRFHDRYEQDYPICMQKPPNNLKFGP